MLEVIAVTPDDARIAASAGAGRIELVSALSEGGLTPGFGLTKQTVRAVRIPVNVMVRPHSRCFHYSTSEIEVMKEEIASIREAGANGIVLGVLDANSQVHVKHLEALLACAEGLEVTFHRAIDEVDDPVEAVRILSRYPVIRSILTSGGPGDIADHTVVLADMQEAAGATRIMVGGGLTFESTPKILVATGLRDVHYGTAVRVGRSLNGAMDPNRVAALRDLLVSHGVDPVN
jgi:copper homeostasis protein